MAQLLGLLLVLHSLLTVKNNNMITTNEKLTGVLNDLIQINNDRITGYEKASKETEKVDVDLRAVFSKMADESRKYKSELTAEVSRLGGEPATGTTNLGKIYRVWMDVKVSFSGNDRQAILESCEFGEDAAQKAYKDALASDAEMDADTRQLITNQQAALKTSHDLIKKYRDAHKAANN
jgi:uncharacterized protein (TIGR02284 family)